MFMFEYFGIFSILQILFVIFIIYSGIMLLGQKSWARLSLEVVTWLSLLYIVGFGIFWVFTWISITGQVTPNENEEMIGVIIGTIISLVFAIPLGFIIKYLRSDKTREECIN